MSSDSIPAIAELRQRVYKSEQNYGRIPWISKRIIHPHVSIYFTKLFLLLGLSGNQVTLLMMACAFAGAGLFFVGDVKGFLGGAVLMLLSWILDHSDGEVLRFRGESSSVGIYLDRFTHRVSCPLMHLGIAVSLSRQAAEPAYMLFGALVAYFYQLGVAHSLDKTLIDLHHGNIDLNPLRTLRQRITARLPSLGFSLKIIVGVYSQLIQNNSFVVLLSIAVFLDRVQTFYLAYGCIVIFNWVLTTVLDFAVAFRRNVGHESVAGAELSDQAITIKMH